MTAVFVFDIDNTLFDTFETILDCYQKSLDNVVGPGLLINNRAIQTLKSGGTWDQAWRHIPELTETQAVAIRETKHRMYRHRVKEVQPFHSTLTMFRSLAASSRIVIWSNSQHEVILLLLQSVGISEDSVTIIGRQLMAAPKPSAMGLISFLEEESISHNSVCVIDDSSETIANVARHGISTCLWNPGIR